MLNFNNQLRTLLHFFQKSFAKHLYNRLLPSLLLFFTPKTHPVAWWQLYILFSVQESPQPAQGAAAHG